MRRARQPAAAAVARRAPTPHPSGARPPAIPADKVPRHVAVVMDGNGRWAAERGLPRTEGHAAGESSLFDLVEGAIELGVGWVSAYAFSTENWRRSPDEVRYLMGFNRDVIRRRRDEMHELGVRVRWAGRRPRLWRSVIAELEAAEELTRDNDVLTLTMCVNYGGRAEIADAAAALAADAVAGKVNPAKVTEATLARYLDEPDMPDVDLFLRSSGEQRTSNFLLWQSAYAEMAFIPTLWPDVDRRHLFAAVEEYAGRERRLGGAVTNEEQGLVASVRLHHVNIVVPPGGTEQAAAFWGGVLGLRRAGKAADAGRPEGAWFDLPGGQQVHLSEREGRAHPDSHVALVADDYDRLVAALPAFGPRPDLLGARRGVARDPFGNLVEVIERAGRFA